MSKKEELTTQILWLRGPLPGFNELIEAAKSGHGKSNGYKRLKSKYQKLICEQILIQNIKPCNHRVYIEFEWYELSRRRDPDNIASGGRKLIFDALVQSRIIQDDGWKNIAGFSDKFRVDKHPHIDIIIREVNK